MVTMTRKDYAAMYGPTTGDLVRLGDTSLLVEVEHDHAVYGEECVIGGGKTLRDGGGHRRRPPPRRRRHRHGRRQRPASSMRSPAS